MPEGSISRGPYASAPSADDARVCAPIDRGVPEEIPYLVWTRPDFLGLEHRIIRTFAIDRKKRPNRECIPCAICSGQNPKYLDGAVLWSSDGTLRIIGHQCARQSEHFGSSTYEGMLRKASQKHLDSVAWDWFYPNISNVKQLMVDLLEVSRVATFIDAQSKEFCHNLPNIWKALKNFADRNNGTITVEVELSGSRLVASEISGFANRAAQSKYETISIAVMQGTPLFKRPKRTWASQIEGCRDALAAVPEGEGDSPMEELIARGDNEPTVTAGMILRNLERAKFIADELDNALRFFEADNIKTLEVWGHDSRNMLPFKIERFGQQIQIIAPDFGRARLSAVCPKFPDLSLLNRIVSDGSSLSGLLREK